MTPRFLILPVAILAFIGGMAVNQQAHYHSRLFLSGYDCANSTPNFDVIWECKE